MSSLNENVDNGADAETLSQVPDVVELVRIHGREQPKMREMAAEFFLGVSDSEQGRRTLHTNGVIRILARWTGDMESVSVNSFKCLVNMSADMLEERNEMMIAQKIVERIFEAVRTDDNSHEQIHSALMLLANITSSKDGSREALQLGTGDQVLVGQNMRRLVERFIATTTSKASVAEKEVDAWEHVASVLCNITQLQEGRDLLRRRSTRILPALLPQLTSPSVVRRRGIAASLRNCCYETQDHTWLLHEIGILSHLLLPLAGPEELAPDERDNMEELLLSTLDRVGTEKIREPDEETRGSLLNAVHLLCTEKASRQYLRSHRAYPIIRNLDMAESSESLKEIAFNIVNFLVRDEEEGDNEAVMGQQPQDTEANGENEDLPPPPSGRITESSDLLTYKRDVDEQDAAADSTMLSVD